VPALSNLHYLQEKFLTLTKGLTKWHFQISNESKFLEDRAKKLEEAQLQVKILTSKNEEIQDKFETMRRKKKDQATYFEKHEREWQSEHARLENHILLLSDQLAKLQGEGSLDAMASKLTEQQLFMAKLGKEFNSYKEVERTKKVKLEQELGQIKGQMEEKKEAFAQFEKEKQEFESRLMAKDDEVREWQCRVQEHIESAMMLAEETRRYIEYKEKYDRLFVLHEELKRTYTKLENGVKSGNVGAFGGEMIVPLDDPLFKKATERGLPEQNNRRLSSSSKVKKTEIDSDIPIDLTKFTYLRPNFAAFIEDSMPDGHQSLFEPPFGNWLEATIRGIFDSKHYEHLMCSEETGRKPSRFPDFVYAWTGHFMIDENTRQVKNLERWQKERSDKWRLMLLLGVKHEMAKRVWEISTFKEFLMEELSTDELAFYLHCRFLLFDGPQLGITLGRFKHLHYVLLKKAKEVVDLIMSKLPEKLLGDVRSLLSEHARRKDNELQIESSLVLRVMLEYYRKEKQVKYRAIKQLFDTCRSNSTTAEITFFNFRSIVDNLKWDMTECQLAGFYRDCWAAGCGIIDHDTFFLVANESTYFLKSLRLKGVNAEPPLGADNLIARQESPSAELMSSIYETWQSTASSFAILKEGLTLMGQPEIAHFVLKLDNYIKKKGQLPPDEYNGWSIAETFKHLWVMILRLDLAFQEYNSLSKPIVYTAEDFSNATSGKL
jgi:hypothetical protein